MQVESESSVDEVISRFPRTASAFIQRRMHCVGCPLARFETLADVCAIYSLPLDSLLAELRTLAGEEHGPSGAGNECSA